MFFRKAFNGFNDWWRYIIAIIAIMVGYTVGQIPLYLALSRSSDENPDSVDNALSQFADEPNFEVLGINSNMGFALLLMMFVAAMTAFFFVFKPLHHREFKTLITPKSRINWSKIFFAFFVWLGLALVMEAIAYFIAPQDYSFHFQFNTFIPLLILSVLLLPVQTTMEELVFRGYLFQGIGTMKLKQILPLVLASGLAFISSKSISRLAINLEDYSNTYSVPSILAFIGGIICLFLFYKILSLFFSKLTNETSGILNRNFKIIPLIITAILFGLIHSMNPEIEKYGFGIMQLYYISAGLVLGIMTIMDDGLELALGVHAATNFTGAVFVGYDGAAIQTNSLLKTSNLNPTFMALGFIVISLIFLTILKYKYQWSSFNKIWSPIDQTKDIV